MKHLLSLFILFTITTCHGQHDGANEKSVGGPCEDCELIFAGMPANLNWKTQIAGPKEPGEKLTIHGIIYKADGKTPAPNVILYVYHTDNSGRYTPAPEQKEARRHGHLRGWIKTGSDGRYEFTTIRPAAYPGRKDPQHIHPLIKEEGKSVYWINDFLFEDDPLLKAQPSEQHKMRGGSGVLSLERTPKGWVGYRDIILGLNVPGY